MQLWLLICLFYLLCIYVYYIFILFIIYLLLYKNNEINFIFYYQNLYIHMAEYALSMRIT